jgi:hypothetical protein
MVAFDSAPPVRMFRYSRKLPFVAFSETQLCTLARSRNGTVTADPSLKMIIMMSV